MVRGAEVVVRVERKRAQNSSWGRGGRGGERERGREKGKEGEIRWGKRELAGPNKFFSFLPSLRRLRVDFPTWRQMLGVAMLVEMMRWAEMY